MKLKYITEDEIMKKILSAILVLACIMALIPQAVLAYQFPQSFWPINDAYMTAFNNNDHYGVIEHGTKTVELMLGEPDNADTLAVLSSRYQAMAESYAAIGQFDKSAEMFETFIPYGEKIGWEDSVIIAKAKIFQYRARLRVFTDGAPSVYYGAKNEPENGILYGVCSDGPTREKMPDESMLILYHELGDGVSGYEYDVFKKADASGIAIEYALNCPNEGADISWENYYEHNLSGISEMFAQYPNVPVFLRFAAEFDVWSDMVEPDKYIKAFRYVAEYFKSRNSNVAMVFSPNHVSGMYTNVDDFYPGDEYVDWVGMSSYYQKYLQGDANAEDFTQILFKTGINSDPVLAVENIINLYGGRKPIMISESGFTSLVRRVGEDTTDWAVKKMREFYTYLPMVYPQVKLIAHFDKEMPYESDRFELYNVPALQREYLSLTKGGRFIQEDAKHSAQFAYNEITDEVSCGNYLNLYSYAHIYSEDTAKVEYYVDGALKGVSAKMPFNATLDLTDVSDGGHTLKVVAVGSEGQTAVKEFGINKWSSDDGAISVTLDGKKIEFDQPPVLYRDRTMVPLRAIFEALDAQVGWDAETETAYGTKDGVKVSAVIGNSNIFKNDTIIPFDVPSIVLNDRTLVPARAVAESFGCKVGWDDATNTVIITR